MEKIVSTDYTWNSCALKCVFCSFVHTWYSCPLNPRGAINADVSTTNNTPTTAVTSRKLVVSSQQQDIKPSLCQRSPNEQQQHRTGGILFRPEERVVHRPVPRPFSAILHPNFLSGKISNPVTISKGERMGGFGVLCCLTTPGLRKDIRRQIRQLY